VRGRELLYDYCTRRGVPHRRLGKLVVAAEEPERAALEALMRRAQDNGVDDLRWLEGEQAMRLEPALRCAAAMESPDSGIVEVPELVMALVGELEQRGGRVQCGARVTAIKPESFGFRVETAEAGAINCRVLINSAGLSATEVAASIEGFERHFIPRQRYASGHYYNVHGRSPFSRLIYPMPEHAGLGVHLGLDMAGRFRFGPDVRWIHEPDYRFDDSQRAQFAASIRRWWPPLKDGDLMPDFVGVRPKLVGPGQPSGDFVIQGPAVHAMPGLVNLFGIESPGLTSCLAIAEEVAALLPS
jgi:L-2-hydroxyglutarate oxidase LhgO